MAYNARRVEYFYITVNGEPREAYELLTSLAHLGISLLALTSVPLGPRSIQLTLFPDDPSRLQSVAKGAGMTLNGPHSAVLVQGDDKTGALAGIHHELHQAGVDVYASSGVTDGKGYFGYILYLRPEDSEKAGQVLAAVAV